MHQISTNCTRTDPGDSEQCTGTWDIVIWTNQGCSPSSISSKVLVRLDAGLCTTAQRTRFVGRSPVSETDKLREIVQIPTNRKKNSVIATCYLRSGFAMILWTCCVSDPSPVRVRPATCCQNAKTPCNNFPETIHGAVDPLHELPGIACPN